MSAVMKTPLPNSTQETKEQQVAGIEAAPNLIKNQTTPQDYLSGLPAEIRSMVLEKLPPKSVTAVANTNSFLRHAVAAFRRHETAKLLLWETVRLREWPHSEPLYVTGGLRIGLGGYDLSYQHEVASCVADIPPGCILADIALRQRAVGTLPCYHCLENLSLDNFLPLPESSRLDPSIPNTLPRRRCIDCRTRTRVFDDAGPHKHGFYRLHKPPAGFRFARCLSNVEFWYGVCIECGEPRVRARGSKYRNSEDAPWNTSCLECASEHFKPARELWNKGRPDGMTRLEWVEVKRGYVRAYEGFYKTKQREGLCN